MSSGERGLQASFCRIGISSASSRDLRAGPNGIVQERTLFPFGLSSRGGSDRDWIVVCVTCRTMTVAVWVAARTKQSFEAQITETVSTYVAGDVIHIEICGNEFLACWRIHTKETWSDRRRTTDANVNFFGSCLSNHLHYLLGGGSANNRIINQDNTQSFY